MGSDMGIRASSVTATTLHTISCSILSMEKKHIFWFLLQQPSWRDNISLKWIFKVKLPGCWTDTVVKLHWAVSTGIWECHDPLSVQELRHGVAGNSTCVTAYIPFPFSDPLSHTHRSAWQSSLDQLIRHGALGTAAVSGAPCSAQTLPRPSLSARLCRLIWPRCYHWTLNSY